MRTRGIRGELFAEIYSSRPGRAERLQEVRLEKTGLSRTLSVERAWSHNGRPVLKFAGIDTMSDAETWQGADILVEQAELPDPGEYSHADLIGCTLVCEASGRTAGVVRDVEDYGGTPLLKLESAEGREILVPFARSICHDVDVARKMIRARLPEGLMDL